MPNILRLKQRRPAAPSRLPASPRIPWWKSKSWRIFSVSRRVYEILIIGLTHFGFLFLSVQVAGAGARGPQVPRRAFMILRSRPWTVLTKVLADYKGQVLLIVNTASHCGFTPQYAGLEKLYERYKGRGFTILAFPANDFWARSRE